MRFEIFSFGKCKEKCILEAENEYLKRFGGKNKVTLRELPVSRSSSTEVTQTKEKEAKLFLSEIETSDYLVVLDERGVQKTSTQLASWIEELMNRGTSSMKLAIGSPFGWHDSVKRRANLLFSLSQLTFPSHLARMLMIEQLYRALSIINGSNYHKE